MGGDTSCWRGRERKQRQACVRGPSSGQEAEKGPRGRGTECAQSLIAKSKDLNTRRTLNTEVKWTLGSSWQRVTPTKYKIGPRDNLEKQVLRRLLGDATEKAQ